MDYRSGRRRGEVPLTPGLVKLLPGLQASCPVTSSGKKTQEERDSSGPRKLFTCGINVPKLLLLGTKSTIFSSIVQYFVITL